MINKKLLNFSSLKKNSALVVVGLTGLILGLALFISSFNLLKTIILLALLFLIIIGLLIVFINEGESKQRPDIFRLEIGLLDSLAEGVVAYDHSFKIIFANQSFAQLVDLSRDQLIGLTVEQAMIKNEKYKKLVNIFFPFLEGEGIKILSKEPEIIEVKFSSPVEKYFLITYLNLEQTLKFRLRIVLDRTQDILDNQRKTEFFQFLSHSILTPLNELKWILESFNVNALDTNNKELYDLTLSIVKNSIIFFELIIANLKLETAQLVPQIGQVKINQTLLIILDILKEQIKSKNLKIKVELDEKVNFLPADESLFLLALYSLIENAIIYNKDNGSVEITVEKIIDGSYLRIIVSDTGIGMSEEELKNVSTKYYRGPRAADKKPKGFGIGLYMAKKIAELHGGDLKIESKENQGTKITILWPTNISQ
jgi:signal transduction histidine kinase